MKDLEFLDKQILFLQESIRIQGLMTNKKLINESIINGIADDALRASIKTGIKDAIRDTIDDVIKNASKETAENLLKGNVKKVLGDGFISKNFNKIQTSVESKLGQTLAPQEKLAITTELKNMKLNGQLDDIYKKTGQEVTQTYSQRLSKIAQGSASSKTLDKSGQKIVDYAKNNVTKTKSWWKGKFQKWGWVDNFGKITSKGRRRILQVLGGSVLAWWLMSGNDDDPMPTPTPNPNPTITPNPTIDPIVNYKPCNNFPYKLGCQNTIIAEIQQCLGLKTNGNFGLELEKTLESKGYGKEITKEVYDKIKTNCGKITTNSTTTTTTLSYDQQYGFSPTPQSFEGGTQTSLINADDI